MTHNLFPSSNKCGEIFNDFLYNYSSFEKKYRQAAISIEPIPLNGKTVDGLGLKKKFWGVTQKLMIFDPMPEAPNHRGITFLTNDSAIFNAISYFLEQRISVGEYDIINSSGRNLFLKHYPNDSRLLYARMVYVQIEMNHSQRFTLTLFAEIN